MQILRFVNLNAIIIYLGKCSRMCIWNSSFISAYANQYLFLTSFTFMAAMSCEIWLQIRSVEWSYSEIEQVNWYSISHFSGRKATEKRYRIEMLICYGAPLLISLLTGIVEATAPRCSTITPRFGELTCFFSSNIKNFNNVPDIL